MIASPGAARPPVPRASLRGWDLAHDIFWFEGAKRAMTCQGSVRHCSSAQGPRRRVWWAPTDDKARSDFGGMYWTATVMKKTASGYKVVYDNGARVRGFRPASCASMLAGSANKAAGHAGEVATVDSEDVFLVPPVAFGKEEHALQVRVPAFPPLLRGIERTSGAFKLAEVGDQLPAGARADM